MKNSEVFVTAKSIEKRKKITKGVFNIVIANFVVFLFVFTILFFVTNGGQFTVSLASNLYNEKRISIYEIKDDIDSHRRLSAEAIDTMDNISIDWLPKDIDTEKDGSHNGDNYIAYSFYVENTADDLVNYYSEVFIDDVIKNVDEAVRIMIYQNGQKEVYAKVNSVTKEAEKNTIPFRDTDKIIIKKRENFMPGDIDRYTVVIWLEGSDEDCVNRLIGGELKLHMEITDELIEEGKK